MKRISFLSCLGCTAAFGLSTIALNAQTVSDSSVPNTSLNLPDGLTVFGNDNPNERRATAIVNGEIITGTDIDHRMALILNANGGEVSDEEKQRLRLQVLRNLIDETLQIQEAAANEIEVPSAEVQQTYARVAQQNFRTNANALDQRLVEVGSSPDSLKRQIHGELAWQRLLGRNITPFVNVAEEEVQAVLDRLEAAKGTDEYRIGEIYLSANPNNAAEVFENGRRIIQQIQQGGSFVAYARQFSEASTASVGGDLGWIRLAQLPQQLSTTAQQLAVGQIAGPVEIPGGFSIVYLIDKRQVLTADPRDAILSLKQLAISLPESTSQEAGQQLIERFAEQTRTIRGCGDADRIAAELGAAVVDNDQIRVRDLPTALQNILLDLSIGESTQPFGSPQDGIRVLVLCGRDDPQTSSGPTFDEMMGTMEDQRISKRAQIYLRDLRRDAIIDYN